MLEDFIVALQGFKSHKLRTVLSLLGIIIGIMAVVIITTLGSSMYGSLLFILKETTTAPMNLIEIYPQWSNETKGIAFEPNEEYRQGLYRASNKITHVFYTLDFPVSVLRGSVDMPKEEIGQNIHGVEWEYLEMRGYKLEYGSYFKLSDYAERRQKAIISFKLASKLFPEGNAVGKKFQISVPNHSRNPLEKPKPLVFFFEVVGVAQRKDEKSFGYDSNIYVPLSFITALTHKKSVDFPQVFIKNEEDFWQVKEDIIKYSDRFSNVKDSVYVFGMKEAQKTIDEMLGMIQIVLSAVAFVSLFVGGVNIMNIMTATVMERKKEIGIRKAIGATNIEIVTQFLIEAITLTLTGCVFGVLFGLGISYIVVGLIPMEAIVNIPMKMEFIINIKGTIIAFIVSICVGIFFGLRPAIKAAKLDPILALG